MIQLLPLTALVLAPQASSASQPMMAAEPEAIAALLEAQGYKTQVSKLPSGTPQVIANDATGSTNIFMIRFYDCDNNHEHCSSVQFLGGHHALPQGATQTSESIANNWNSGNTRYVFAYVNAAQELWIEMDLNMAGGVTRQYFLSMLHIWVNKSSQFEQFQAKALP